MPTPSVTSLPFYAPSGSSKQWKGLTHIVTVSGIDGLATGNTPLITVPTGYALVVDKLVVRVTAVTGSATTGAVSLINSTDTVDLIANTTLTSLVTAGLSTKLTPAAAAPGAAAGKVVSFKIGTAYTVASVVTLAVDLHCYFV